MYEFELRMYLLSRYILKELSKKYTDCEFFKVDVDDNVSYNAIWYGMGYLSSSQHRMYQKNRAFLLCPLLYFIETVKRYS